MNINMINMAESAECVTVLYCELLLRLADVSRVVFELAYKLPVDKHFSYCSKVVYFKV